MQGRVCKCRGRDPLNWRLRAGLLLERVNRRLASALDDTTADRLLDACMAPDPLMLRVFARRVGVPLRRLGGRLWP